MSYGHQIQQYRTNAILHASPFLLIVHLYDGAIRFLEKGKIAMIAEDFFEQNTNFTKVQNILFELIATLDREKGGDLANNLYQIYLFLDQQVGEASLKQQPETIDRIKKILIELREGWAQVAQESDNKENISPNLKVA